jgi:hypothetical protein
MKECEQWRKRATSNEKLVEEALDKAAAAELAMKDSERQLQLRGEKLEELQKLLEWYMQHFGSPDEAMRDRNNLGEALSTREAHLAELQAKLAKDADVSRPLTRHRDSLFRIFPPRQEFAHYVFNTVHAVYVYMSLFDL